MVVEISFIDSYFIKGIPMCPVSVLFSLSFFSYVISDQILWIQPLFKSLTLQGVWVPQWLSICLWLRSWSWGPAMESHIRLPAGSRIWDSIAGPQDHDLSQRQMLNHWGTQTPWRVKDLKRGWIHSIWSLITYEKKLRENNTLTGHMGIPLIK